MTCYHCKFEIPDGASICGHCRKPPKFQPIKAIFTVIFGGLFLIVFLPLLWAFIKAIL